MKCKDEKIIAYWSGHDNLFNVLEDGRNDLDNKVDKGSV
jgi:cell division septal protein FtsQ